MIHVYWDSHQSDVIRLDYTDPVKDWDEYDTAIAKSNEMALSKHGDVYLFHVPSKAKMPASNKALQHIRWAVRSTPKNVVFVVMFISNPIARHLTSLAIQLVTRRENANYLFVNSIKAGNKAIRHHKQKE